MLKNEREIGPKKSPSRAVLRICGCGLRWAMRNPPEPWRCVVGRGQMARTKSEWALGRADMRALDNQQLEEAERATQLWRLGQHSFTWA